MSSEELEDFVRTLRGRRKGPDSLKNFDQSITEVRRCLHCGKDKAYRHGRDSRGTQRFRCRPPSQGGCKRTFNGRMGAQFARMRKPKKWSVFLEARAEVHREDRRDLLAGKLQGEMGMEARQSSRTTQTSLYGRSIRTELVSGGTLQLRKSLRHAHRHEVLHHRIGARRLKPLFAALSNLDSGRSEALTQRVRGLEFLKSRRFQPFYGCLPFNSLNQFIALLQFASISIATKWQSDFAYFYSTCLRDG